MIFFFSLFPNVLPPLFCLPHLAGCLIPAVSAFALSWKQQCDGPWVGVRDELLEGYWGCGGSRFLHQRVGAGSVLVGLDWNETEMGDRVERKRSCFGTGEEKPECVSPPSPPAGTLLLCGLVDLKSVEPSLHASRAGPASSAQTAAARRALKMLNFSR